MSANILQLYKQAIDARESWVRRWTQCQRFSLPTADDESATLFDATAGDAVENLAASMYSLLTPPESLWLNLIRENEIEALNESITYATNMLRTHLNDSNFLYNHSSMLFGFSYFGDGVFIHVGKSNRRGQRLFFTAIPMSDIAITRGAIFHTTTMPAAEVAEKISRMGTAKQPARDNKKIIQKPRCVWSRL